MLGRPGRAGGVITVCRFREGGTPGREERLAQVLHGPQPPPTEREEGEFPNSELGAPGVVR